MGGSEGKAPAKKPKNVQSKPKETTDLQTGQINTQHITPVMEKERVILAPALSATIPNATLPTKLAIKRRERIQGKRFSNGEIETTHEDNNKEL